MVSIRQARPNSLFGSQPSPGTVAEAVGSGVLLGVGVSLGVGVMLGVGVSVGVTESTLKQYVLFVGSLVSKLTTLAKWIPVVPATNSIWESFPKPSASSFVANASPYGS